jgi:hypothetical protein
MDMLCWEEKIRCVIFLVSRARWRCVKERSVSFSSFFVFINHHLLDISTERGRETMSSLSMSHIVTIENATLSIRVAGSNHASHAYSTPQVGTRRHPSINRPSHHLKPQELAYPQSSHLKQALHAPLPKQNKTKPKKAKANHPNRQKPTRVSQDLRRV